MKNILRTERGFTLIEMMIVLLIISILLMIAIPVMSKSNSTVKNKSCKTTVRLVQGQVSAYQMDHDGKYPSDLGVLKGEYVDKVKCPEGKLKYDEGTGKVTGP